MNTHPYAFYLQSMGIRYFFSSPGHNSSSYSDALPDQDHGTDADSHHEQHDSSLIPEFLLAQLRPAYAVFTYFNLYQDLQEGFNSQQGKLLTTILSHLGWPDQSIAFWPVSRAHDLSITPDPEFFLHGLNLIKPAYIFCFGAQAFRVFMSPSKFVYGKWYYRDIRVLALPDLDAMLPDNRILKNFTWHILHKFSPLRI